jgi:hypothetical protein
MIVTAKRRRSTGGVRKCPEWEDKAASIGGLVAGLCNRSPQQQQRDHDHDDDQRDDE